MIVYPRWRLWLTRLLARTTCRVCGYRGPRSQFIINRALDIHRCNDMDRCERNWKRNREDGAIVAALPVPGQQEAS